MALDWATDDVLSMVCVIFYNLIYGRMEVDKIITGFFVIGEFVEPLFTLPDFVIYLLETIVSMRRIQDFLYIKEYDQRQIEYIKNKDNIYSVEINHVDFGVEKTIEKESENKNEENKSNNSSDKQLYPKEIEMENIDDNENDNDDNEHLVLSTNLKNELVNNSNKKKVSSTINPKIQKIILLKDINIQIKKGEHIGIIGEVGSGKTCLLNAIINNLEVFTKNNSKGNIKLSGKISFVSQNPWILNTTIEENILFFSPKDEEKYKKIINICQLDPDLLTLQKGDQTEIGEKGLNLSGGQKARISIARAIYTDSEIYIFDDP
jgi:ABC-type multidrug transport system fused ATPase/permease subunit